MALEPHEFLHRLVEQAAHLLKGQASAIWLADEASGLIRVAESYQMSPDIQSELAIRVGEHIVGRVVATATPIALPDALWDPRVAHRSRLLQDGLRAMIHVPLRDGHRAIGSLSVYFREVHDFQLHELELLAALGDHAVTGLRNCRLFEAMKQEAITDGLTGLYNHRYFQQRMDEELRRAQLERQTLSLLFCDLDHFKLFNDLHGHDAGDQALHQVAGLIRKIIRAVDLPARYGGEEFAIILPETGDREAFLVAERLRREVAGLGFHVRSSALATLTISIGIASFPQDAQDRQALLDKADWAMYCAKRKGRNQVRRFSVEQESYSLGGPPPLPLRDVTLPVVHALAAAVDARDPSTARHSEEVAQLATALACHMGLPEEEVRRVTLAARLHDVGKIGIPDAVLHKSGPLGREEQQLLCTHPVIARSIMGQVPELEGVIPLVYHQQERYEGGGHPEGLKGQAIPRGARIIAVANAYQAMISARPYRSARTEREALEALGLERGKCFDPEVVDALVALVDGESDGRRFSEAAPTPSPADPARS
ncbi:MAG: diguanylate cyclase [Deltaproteobacteria bacterium]|nr:diguanylate cyclase [Deltaproteobacteria bacterium]